jgi:type VI secretion system secreted protein VgrG
MPELEANRPRFFFECADLAPETFEVARFQGVEEIGVPFRFEVELFSKDPAVDFAKVLDRPSTLTLRRGQHERRIVGVVAEIEQGGRDADLSKYRAVLVPRLARLGLGRRSRTFGAGLALPDLVKELVEEGEAGPADLQLQGAATFVPDRWVQHRESDLAFFSRRLEHAGAWFFFREKNDKDEVVVADSRSAHEPIAGDSAVPYVEQIGLLSETSDDVIERFVVRQGMAVAEAVERGWDGREGRRVEESEKKGGPGRRGTLAEHAATQRKADADSARLDPPSLRDAATVRAESAWAWQTVAEGASDAVRFLPGHLFDLARHYREDLNTTYLLTRVVHEGSQTGGVLASAPDDADAQPEYRNTFEALPASVPFRPKQRTPVPYVPGVTTGLVTGEVDERGDYRAAVQGDEDPTVDRAAVRLAQPYAGAGYGIHFPNLTDTEFVVAYLDGDADRPIALGAVPNGKTASPVTAENRTEHVVRTAAGHELVMDDEKDKTSVRLVSVGQNQLTLRDPGGVVVLQTKNGQRVRLSDGGGSLQLRTKGGHFLQLQDERGQQSEGDEEDQQKVPSSVRLQTKKGHFLAISEEDGKESITISDEKGDHTITLDIENSAIQIKTKGSMSIEAEEALDIKAKSIKMESTGEAIEIEAKTEIKQTSGTDTTIESKNNLTVKASMKAGVEAGMDLGIKGMNVKSEAQMKHEIKGMTTTSEGMTQNEVKGLMVGVKGSAMTEISGGLVKIN